MHKKGKIKRYFRTVRGQFLPELPENITLDKLNDLFTNYVENIYHKRRHGTTGETPLNRYLDDGKTLRRAPDNLPDFFIKKETRIVNNDINVKLDGQLFEAPIGLIGYQVTLRFENYERIEVFLDEKSKGFLTRLNPAINSRVKRVIDGSDNSEDLNHKIFEKKYLKGKGLYE